MAEIGLVGTVVGLASAGVKLSLTLYTFSETVSSAGTDIKNIARDVSLTSSVLKELGTNLEQDDQTKLYSSSALQTAKEVVRECESVFIDLEKVMQKATERTSKKASKPGKLTLSAFDKLTCPFLQPKMEVLRSNLERLKSTLVLMLNVLTYAKDLRAEKNSSTKDEGGYQKMLIENLIRANQEATRNYETLLKTIEARENTLNDGHSGTRDPEDGASIAGTTINMSSISDLEPPASTVAISNDNTPINLEQVPADEGSEVESTMRACLKRIEDTLLPFEQSDSAATSEPRIGVRIELEKEVSAIRPETRGPPKPWVGLSIARKDAPSPLETHLALQAGIDDTIAAMHESTQKMLENTQKMHEHIQTMHENIQKVSQRGERLDSLQDKTDNLAVSAQGFRRGANRVRKRNCWNVKNWVYTAGAAVASVPKLVSKATQGFFADEDDAFEDPGTVLEYHENLNIGSSSPRPPSRSPTFDDILQPVSPKGATRLADLPEIVVPTSRMKIDLRDGQSKVSPIQQEPQWRSFIMKDPGEAQPAHGIEYNEFDHSMMVPGKERSDHGVADEDNKVVIL
ncbi:hypothetical protein LTR72_008494 [Exophiala xenobiotica]|nr:hypothetical protein LTR92_008453 [Exophiala xenobiotica]KAK5218555.1 hypothetical protein LTR72_008494 [Exophiala xenobiotica]KAK5290469.1 hypothetical protein LTR14_006772 [Exophiala xenobiotica]KAK5450233.1 hypothetical protein LTR18_000248 [Exophiala xenobiotica]KAK5479987.1 hypothetical protein LTR55_007350 [Exophiala xenobiotica]